MKKRIHFTESYLRNPTHPITVNMIGAGGSGSQMLTCLARMDHSLRSLEHPGLHVKVYDPDTVTEANLGRQLFTESELGLNKAQCLVSRINHFFGFNWEAENRLFPEYGLVERTDYANIMITCTDNKNSRINLAKVLKKCSRSMLHEFQKYYYWLDLGNTQNTGQAILGTAFQKIKQPKTKSYHVVPTLKGITEITAYQKVEEADSGPSCSLAEALHKQDLFINSNLANLSATLLWNLIRNGGIEYHGFYLNLKNMNCNPIAV